jgi:hypothetical protein
MSKTRVRVYSSGYSSKDIEVQISLEARTQHTPPHSGCLRWEILMTRTLPGCKLSLLGSCRLGSCSMARLDFLPCFLKGSSGMDTGFQVTSARKWRCTAQIGACKDACRSQVHPMLELQGPIRLEQKRKFANRRSNNAGARFSCCNLFFLQFRRKTICHHHPSWNLC